MPANMDVPRRGTGSGARLSDCPTFRRLVRRAHGLGPRPLGELLLEAAPDHRVLIRRLERCADLDPAAVDAAGGRDWLEPRALMREVRR
jgi:hypothetical protein